MTIIEFKNQIGPLNNQLLGFAIRLTRNKEDAKDLMQETMIRAFIHCERFTEGTNFKAWLTTIMRNNFINDYRKNVSRKNWKYRLAGDEFELDKQYVINQGPSMMMMQELDSLMDKLSDGSRIPFDLFFNGYKYTEIAEQLDLPIGTVKSRIFFARKKLRNIVHKNYGEHANCA